MRDNLQTLIALPLSTDMGFFDKVRIRPAVHWDQELADALGTCQVLVALLSVPYLRREWCGKEWHAFTLRERVPKPDANRFRIRARSYRCGGLHPLVRTARRGEARCSSSPPQNTADQHELAAMSTMKKVIFGLLRAGKEGAFGDVVWQLAKCIQQIYYNQLLKSKEFDPSELRNVFEDDVP